MNGAAGSTDPNTYPSTATGSGMVAGGEIAKYFVYEAKAASCSETVELKHSAAWNGPEAERIQYLQFIVTGSGPIAPPVDPVMPPIDPVTPPTTDPVNPPVDPVTPTPPTDPVNPPVDPVTPVPPTDPTGPPVIDGRIFDLDNNSDRQIHLTAGERITVKVTEFNGAYHWEAPDHVFQCLTEISNPDTAATTPPAGRRL